MHLLFSSLCLCDFDRNLLCCTLISGHVRCFGFVLHLVSVCVAVLVFLRGESLLLFSVDSLVILTILRGCFFLLGLLGLLLVALALGFAFHRVSVW
jgi:hypothetical protein